MKEKSAYRWLRKSKSVNRWKSKLKRKFFVLYENSFEISRVKSHKKHDNKEIHLWFCQICFFFSCLQFHLVTAVSGRMTAKMVLRIFETTNNTTNLIWILCAFGQWFRACIWYVNNHIALHIDGKFFAVSLPI